MPYPFFSRPMLCGCFKRCIRCFWPVSLWRKDPLMVRHVPAGDTPADGDEGRICRKSRVVPQYAERRGHELLGSVFLLFGKPSAPVGAVCGEAGHLPFGKRAGAHKALPFRGIGLGIFQARGPVAADFGPFWALHWLWTVRLRALILPEPCMAGYALSVPPDHAGLYKTH